MAPAIDFSAIWESETPTIETGLRQPRKEERGEFVLVDELDYDNDEDDEENEDSRRGGDDATEVINGRSMVERRNEPITKWFVASRLAHLFIELNSILRTGRICCLLESSSFCHPPSSIERNSLCLRNGGRSFSQIILAYSASRRVVSESQSSTKYYWCVEEFLKVWRGRASGY